MHSPAPIATRTALAQRGASQRPGPSPFNQALGPGWRSHAAPVPPLEPLTRREREVLGLLVSGPSNRQIATSLSISERTAEAHVANILGKLGLANRAQASAWAARQGFALDGGPAGPDMTSREPVGKATRGWSVR